MNSGLVNVRVTKGAEFVASHLREQIIKKVVAEGDSLPNEA